MAVNPPPAAGWYPDPWQHAPFRWWDGVQWTGHLQQPQPQQPVPVTVIQQGNGLAVASLVCGIVGVVLGLIPILFVITIPLGLIGVILGAVALRRPQRRAMAWWGVALGLVALALGVWGAVIVDKAFS